MSVKMNVPKLRFSGFSGEWEEKKLGEVTSKIGSGSTPSGGEKVYTKEGIFFIRSQNVNNDKLDLFDKTFIPESIHKKMKGSTVLPNDVLLNITGASIGRSCVVPNIVLEANVNQHVCIIRGNKTLDSQFLQSFIASHKGQNLIYQGQTGSGREGLNFQSIASFKIPIPKIAEQQKIASFLSSVDAKIEQLTKKKALLEQYKKGVMQKIFSQELRFRNDDGSEYSEWVERKLGEVAEIIMGQSPESSSYNLDEIGQPLIQGNADIQNRLSNPRNWTTQTTKECKVGDLILTVRAPVGAVAKSVHNACIGRGVCAIRNNSTSKIEFLFQFLLDFESKWGNLEQGSTFTAVSGNEIKKLKIHMPSIKEQTKIANFLSSIDTKIEQVQKQLNSTKQFKKALLQQMFV